MKNEKIGFVFFFLCMFCLTACDDTSYTNSLGMTFNLIPSGTFLMGSPEDEPGRSAYVETQHEVTLTQEFYIQTTEVTQGQWKSVMGSNPAHFSECGDNCPVEMVSLIDVQEFIEKLNSRGEGTYGLPTEAQWEYAARAGSTTAFPSGNLTVGNCDFDENLDAIGWYCGNSERSTHPVAQKQPNEWGLFDTHGNVMEWVQDYYDGYQDYSPTPVVDPKGPDTNEWDTHWVRGGNWDLVSRACRSASRAYFADDLPQSKVGFRLILLSAQ